MADILADLDDLMADVDDSADFSLGPSSSNSSKSSSKASSRKKAKKSSSSSSSSSHKSEEDSDADTSRLLNDSVSFNAMVKAAFDNVDIENTGYIGESDLKQIMEDVAADMD